MKILLSIGAGLVGIIIFGLALLANIPGCKCGWPATPCQGCGELIGNAFGDFVGTCLIFGGMGLVLIMFYGIPLLVIGLIVRGVYRLFSKESGN
jgi:hypothetical protein